MVGWVGGEVVSALNVDVFAGEGAEGGGVFVGNGVSVRSEVFDRGIDVAGVPEDAGVEDEAEGTELVFLAFSVGLA